MFVDLSVVIDSEKEAIASYCFLRGRHNNLYNYPGQSWMHKLDSQRIILGEVDPIVISEVLKDLITVTATQ